MSRAILLLLLTPLLALGQAFTANDIPFMAQGTTDWAQRVVNNGGALPSKNTILAMETLRTGLIAASLTNKIYSLCVFVPDSVIAASTPLFKHKGADPWTNSGFVSGDLTVNGLKGDGVGKFLDTAIIAKLGQGANSVGSSNFGITVIITESATNVNSPIVLNQQFIPGNTAIGLFVSGGGADQYYNGTISANAFVITNDMFRVGYISGSSDTTNVSIYVASPVEAHKRLDTEVTASTGFPSGGAYDTSTFPVFAHRVNGTNSGFNTMRASLVMLHESFTQTESSNFWILAQACRTSLGGGTGDPVHDWARRVVDYGGAAVSVNTSNALRTFRLGLDTDSLLYKMISANAYAPDNLTAARLPVIVQAGNEIWTNTAFGETNLTVNGLTGNGTTKFLGTGINPSTLNYGGFTDTSAGLSVLIYNVGTDANVFNIGSSGTTANGLFAVGNQVGLVVFYCWIFTTVNTDCLIRTAPNAGWEGYLSGNRTAANSIRLDWVTNSVHNVATNATGATASNNNTMTNMFAHAIANGLNAAANFSDQTVSFLAIHPGLTQTESSNLWIRVRDMRNSFGGGVP